MAANEVKKTLLAAALPPRNARAGSAAATRSDSFVNNYLNWPGGLLRGLSLNPVDFFKFPPRCGWALAQISTQNFPRVGFLSRSLAMYRQKISERKKNQHVIRTRAIAFWTPSSMYKPHHNGVIHTRTTCNFFNVF